MVYHPPILNLSLPFLVIKTGRPREAEVPQNPAEHHPHLHQRQILTGAYSPPVRKWKERRRIVFSRRRSLAEPPFRQERLRRVEVACVPMYAVRVERKLRPLRYDSAIGIRNFLSEIRDRIDGSVPLQLAKYFGTLALI